MVVKVDRLSPLTQLTLVKYPHWTYVDFAKHKITYVKQSEPEKVRCAF